MSIRVAIQHHTTYRYDRSVSLTPHVFRLMPAVHCRTPIEAYSLRIEPGNHFINWQQDPFGNRLARVVFPEPCRELSVHIEVQANLTVINPFDFFIEPYAEGCPFVYDEQLQKELVPYLEITERGPLLTDWIASLERRSDSTVNFMVSLNHRLWQDIRYTLRMEPGIQSCEDTLKLASGSCRDSAWLLVQIFRHLGLAARFVSGYLVQLKADMESLDGPSGPVQDFTDLHAWAEVYIPGAGWVGLDPTSGLFAGEGHIPLACTPDPVSAAPITGGFLGEAECEFDFSNSVVRVHEDPRVTKPYSDTEWLTIQNLGEQVDQALQRMDVRLTMGGEPTFVSIDRYDAAEWTTAADGPHKRERAHDLTRRLHSVFAPKGVLQSGLGKWYPGEPLPRWQMGCYWRRDGAPVWHDPSLLADESRDYGLGLAQAQALTKELAMRLGIQPDYMLPGFEDVLYYLWKEGSLPNNIDPLQCDLDDPLERQRLARLLDRGLNTATGYTIPLAWDYRSQSWQSGPWEFRRGHMFLIPGDSPMGLRLPLDSLTWLAPEQQEAIHERSLFEPLPALGDFHGEVMRRYNYFVTATGEPASTLRMQGLADAEDAYSPQFPQGSWVRTALCVEPRNGRLHVFLPPLGYLEHYLELLAAVEASAGHLGLPVVIEGYDPPRDPRLQRLLVTPDPGVIEVNIHPAESWQELVENTEILYEQARLARLGTEKFMLDGRHTGTGGGNHLTLGGLSPSDSPILRRPDLLRSLLTYWQHHPGLSYLFSGLFVGPTSQAPRIDEARHESLYELEIALRQMPAGETPAPWLVDRLLRHLLVDITGNTHRAEFCIDKLYSPDSSRGRLGLLELRAFEMPPHERMALLQNLLVRALLARFWEQPYTHPQVRWGTELHDRFMLPHYVLRDVGEVFDDLRDAGYAFEKSWLDPYHEFRFPHHGTVHYQDIALELRGAIEPWHVLGEEAVSGGTARLVDCSLERVQIKARGLTDSRYLVTCNGYPVPLRNTGVEGEYVAGVRFRAWQPPSCLHPNIGVHAPLVFDLVDLWNDRAVGGCTYHVSHPGGRNYDVFPVNAYEAEARRLTRFWSHGHTPGKIDREALLRRRECQPEYPHTLDLRKTHD